jgi:hypothetical protein
VDRRPSTAEAAAVPLHRVQELGYAPTPVMRILVFRR